MLKRKVVRYLSILALVLSFQMVQPVETNAQCPMCRMSAESNLKNGGTEGKGLNTGILYMLATPYLLVGTIGFLWWRNRRKEEEDREEEEGIV